MIKATVPVAAWRLLLESADLHVGEGHVIPFTHCPDDLI